MANAIIELFRHGTLTVELYAPRGNDPQTPHTRDEIYVIISGNGRFQSQRRKKPHSAPGDLLFVPAGEEHRFVEFSDDFATWVFFYGPEGGEAEVVKGVRVPMRREHAVPSAQDVKVPRLGTDYASGPLATVHFPV